MKPMTTNNDQFRADVTDRVIMWMQPYLGRVPDAQRKAQLERDLYWVSVDLAALEQFGGILLTIKAATESQNAVPTIKITDGLPSHFEQLEKHA